MKNVWILERFVPSSDTRKHIEELRQILKESENVEHKKTAQMLIDMHEKQLSEFPDGYWLGYVGKMKYNEFCYDAKDFMKRNEDGLLKSGIRAVKAEIEDNAKYWTGYKNPVINEKVTKYLYATYRE